MMTCESYAFLNHKADPGRPEMTEKAGPDRKTGPAVNEQNIDRFFGLLEVLLIYRGL